MLVNVRSNCTDSSLHGLTLPIIRVEKRDGKVVVKHGGQKEAILFRDILPAPPVVNGMAQIIFDSKTGRLFGSDAPQPESVRSIQNGEITFDNGDRALIKHCVAVG